MNNSDITGIKMASGALVSRPPRAPRPARHERLTFKANRTQGRHGWLRLTPAYSIHLVEELIARLPPQTLVLDPFCGSGTTALACAQYGVTGHTVDINPFLVWLATAKCSDYSASDIQTARDELGRALNRLDERRTDAWTPPIHDIAKWWDRDTTYLLAQIYEWVAQPSISPRSRDLLLITFCRLSISVASVSFGHQSMSFKKGAPARTWHDSDTPKLFPIAPIERMTALTLRIAEEIFASAEGRTGAGTGAAFLGDARDLRASLPSQAYDAVITSPPYPNRMSYIRELRPYMYWLGYLESGRQAGELDWQAIGGTWGCATSNLTKWEPSIPQAFGGGELNETIAAISQRSPLLSRYVAKYFEDMAAHLRSLRDVLAPGARVDYIVGNSKFYDTMLHTEQLYAMMLRDLAFTHVSIDVLRKRTSKRELFEYRVSARWP